MSAVDGATVIVVGGGILGATTGYELAAAGVDVLLLEAKSFGGQSTGKSAAIVRGHYSNPEVVRMAVHSRETLRRLPLLLDCPPVYTQSGWLFLVDEEDAHFALDNAEMQDGEGLDTVEVEDLQEYLPGIDERGIAYALYEPDAGFADPVATTNAYIDALRIAGGRALERTVVESIELAGDAAVRGVRIDGRLLECDCLVLAAGPWTPQLTAGIGLVLPIEITREQDVVFDTGSEPTIPSAVSSQVDRVYMRPAPEYGESCLLAGRGYPKDYEQADPDGFDDEVDDDFQEDVHERIGRRIPRLAEMEVVGGRVGLYDVTPDWHPLLGAVDDITGLFLATGGSGHCFKLGPAIGQMVAGDVTGTAPTYATAQTFSLSRFDEGRELRSTYGGNRG